MAGHLTTEIRKAKDGWRWRMFRGGNIVAESGEAYVRRQHCTRALLRLGEGLKGLWRRKRGGVWWTVLKSK